MSAPHVIDLPVSASYVIIDGRGRALAEVEAIEEATFASRSTPRAVAVVGAPSGILLARVAKGLDSVLSEAQARIAAKRWARGSAAP